MNVINRSCFNPTNIPACGGCHDIAAGLAEASPEPCENLGGKALKSAGGGSKMF